MKVKFTITFEREINIDHYPEIRGTLELETRLVEELRESPELMEYYLEDPFEVEVKEVPPHA